MLRAGAVATLASLLGSCRDPVDPPALSGPSDLPRWSTAPHVRWGGLDEVPERVGVVVVDEAGGSLDLLSHDPDLATFLNDRFTPWFLIPEVAPSPLPRRGVVFIDTAGCLLAGPSEPADAAEWIEQANQVLLDQAAGKSGDAWPSSPSWSALSPPADHPLQLRCSPPSSTTRPMAPDGESSG